MEKDNISKIISDDDKISRYLQGCMSIDEETEFVEKIKEDANLRQNAITQARLIKGMNDADMELINAFKNTNATDIDKIIANSTKKIAVNIIQSNRKLPIIKWLSIAATIAIIFICSYKGYDYYDTTRLGMQYANTFPISSITRGNSDSTVETELLALFDNVIKQKDLKSTTSRLEELWSLSQEDTYNDYTDYGPYIGWYLAIGYLEDYKKSKATKILEHMHNQYVHNYALNKAIMDIQNQL